MKITMRLILIPIISLFLISLFLIGGCSQNTSVDSKNSVETPAVHATKSTATSTGVKSEGSIWQLTILSTADVGGYLDPCG